MVGLTTSLAGLLLLATTGSMGLPFGVPPTPEDPVLAQVLPEQCLFCLSWAGTASPDPKSPNQTEQLLAEPEVQNFLTQIDRCARYAFQGGLNSLEKDDRNSPIPGNILRCLVTHPGVIFVSNVKSTGKPDFTETEGGMVFSLGEDAALVEAGAKLWAPILQNMLGSMHQRPEGDSDEKGKPGHEQMPKNSKGNKDSGKPAIGSLETIKIDGQDWYRLPSTTIDRPRIVFGFHNGYFIVGVGDNAVENILARMKNGRPPAWWTAIGEQLPVQRRSLVGYADLRELGNLTNSWLDAKQRAKARGILDMLGLGNATSWVEVWGLDGRDFANKTLLTFDGQPRGLLKVVCDRPLKLQDLKPIPRDAAFAAAFRFDPQEALDSVLASLDKWGPETQAATTRQIDEWERLLGLDLRHGTLRSLGDTWCVYGSPSEGNFYVTGLTAVVPLREWAGMNVAYGRLMGLAKQWSPQREGGTPRPEAGNGNAPRTMPIQSFRFADNDVYYFSDEQSAFGMSGMCPVAWCMTKREMVFALSPQNVKAHLSHDERHEPIGRLPQIAELFSNGDGPAMVAYGDARHAFEAFYPLVTLYGRPLVELLRAENPAIDPSLLPSCSSVDRHIGPTVATLRRTKHGVEFVSRGTIPLPSAALWIGAMAWEAMAWEWCEPTGSVTAGPAMAVPLPQPAQAGATRDPNAAPTPGTTPSPAAPVPNEVKPKEKKGTG